MQAAKQCSWQGAVANRNGSPLRRKFALPFPKKEINRVANRPAFPGIVLQLGPSSRCPGVVYSDPAISVTPTLTSDLNG